MYRLNDYLKQRFQTKVYKVALSTGCTCPNRDGTIGVGGCVFCSKNGAGEFASEASLSVEEQFKKGKARIDLKNPGGKYIAYFQSFTNTYASVEKLEPIFRAAMELEDVVAISIATRPDCLPEDILELLERLNQMKPVWVELGLQTKHEKTAQLIRRGYARCEYDHAVKALQSRGIEVIVHVILGLPGESIEDMVQTVQYVVDSGAQGIKLQLLHVLKETDLAIWYEEGRFDVMTEEEYVKAVICCLRCLPDKMVVHRLTGDGSRRELVQPLWSLDKKRVLNRLNHSIAKAGLKWN